MDLFYTYVLTYPNGEVFYVGKGQGDRIDQHEKEAAQGVISHKCKVIRNIWKSGGKVGKYRVLQTPVEEDALLYEWALINLIYGIDNLTNIQEENIPGRPKTATLADSERLHIKRSKITYELPKWKRNREWTFLSPTGEVHRFKNLSQWCKENGFPQTSMHDVYTGLRENYKGWKRAS